MVNLILFGPPGSGKGTQAASIVEQFNLMHISTGDLFRYNMGNNTPLGIEAKSYIEKGELVPDSVTINMLKAKVDENPFVKGFIFDGFPRTIVQAEALDEILKDKGGVSSLLMLDVPDSELIKRLLERGKTSGRKDDLDEGTIQNRLSVYKKETTPVFDYYFAKEKSVKIWGVGSMPMVFNRLALELNNL